MTVLLRRRNRRCRFLLFGLFHALLCIVPVVSTQAADLSVNSMSVDESAGVAQVRLTLSSAVSQSVTVNLATADQTAEQGADYYGAYQIVTIPPGQTERLIALTILEDAVVESNETFSVRIWQPAGANLGADIATISILDNDSAGGTPTVNLRDVRIREDDGEAIVPIVLSSPAPSAVSLEVATAPNTATRGSDYYGRYERVEFAAGERRKNLSVTLLNDDLDEKTEIIDVRLFNIRGAVPGQLASRIIIQDDDSVDLAGNTLAVHVLNRMGFGPGRWGAQRINAIGIDAYIEEQLDPSRLPADTRRCDGCIDGKVYRAVNARRQLVEVLVDFWFNHFNVDTQSVTIRNDLPRYERDVIRANVFGQFEDMLTQVAKSPAMLRYLDNRVNTREGYTNSAGRVFGLNENYSRELMELHTLGIDGGYDENDVIEVARILTGWSLRSGSYAFVRNYHDTDPKRVMNGQFIVTGDEGEMEGERLMTFLARHSSTARFISYKLIQRFVAETPPASLVDAAAQSWLSTNGNLRAVLRTILTSQEFRNPANFGQKIKSPLHLLVSAARAMGRTGLPDAALADYQAMLLDEGQEIYRVAPPTGVPENTRFWVAGGTMLTRFDDMSTLAQDSTNRNGVRVTDGADSQIVDQIATAILPQGIDTATRAQIITHLGTLPASTSFEQRKTKALALVLSSPEFMRH